MRDSRGDESWSGIEEFEHNKLKWLREYVPLANGIPADDTVVRITEARESFGIAQGDGGGGRGEHHSGGGSVDDRLHVTP